MFLGTADLPDVLGYLRDVEDELPRAVRKGKVVFFWQDNGFAELYGLCAERVGRWPAGAVVHLDHESQELTCPYPDLMAFERGTTRSRRCSPPGAAGAITFHLVGVRANPRGPI